jgi:glycosyltransferase involved in cell wall biosynthesis
VRILWSSVSPFVGSGYGMQTSVAAKRLKSLGHDVAILCYYGLEGSKTEWGDITLYPNDPRDYGVIRAPLFYNDFKADLLITLVDVWVLRGMDPTLRWCPWMPIDHDPIPPLVLDAVQKCAGIIKPIAMSKFGMKQLNDRGIDCYYIPHTVNTKLFSPNAENRAKDREKQNWSNKFVIGTVATNQVERKNWNASFQAVAKFEKMHPGEIIWYAHTNMNDDKGINLTLLSQYFDMKHMLRVPSIAEMNIGISQEVMARIYNSMDVFLLPSKGEGFGIPLIEAQSCGVPIITTNCTAQTELMGGGWFINNLKKEWTAQGSWQFGCEPDEIVERLEQAYQAKKSGQIEEERKKALAKAMEYDEDAIFSTYWPSVLADIEKKLKEPKNMEGVQKWRLAFLPQSIVPKKVLDLGSGLTVPYKPYLENLGEYTAVDIRGGEGIIKADAHKLPFRNKEFGFVWCSEMLEHVTEPEKVVAEARRVGVHGVILFSTPMTPSFKIDPDHKVVDPRKVHYATMGSGDGMVSW